jgi:hypothetical protein
MSRNKQSSGSLLRLVRDIGALLGVIVATWSASGCFSGKAKYDVQGQVTLDGHPLEEGSILLVPTDATTGTTTGGQITQGQFRLTGAQAAPPGEYKVEIRATRKSGRMVQKAMGAPGELMPEMIEAVAPRFNTASQLRVVVTSGPTTADFQVFGR